MRRSLFHLGPDFRRDRDQLVIDNVLANRLQIFRDFREQILRGGVFGLDLPEDFARRFVRVDLLRGFGKDFLFAF